MAVTVCGPAPPWSHEVIRYEPPANTPRSLPVAPVIAVIGIDGVGKTTQVRALASWLAASHGFPIAATKLGGSGDWTLKRLAEKMFGDPFDYHPGIPPTVRAINCCSDAVAYYHATLLPLLGEGRAVISDRFSYCEQAYFQAYGADMTWPLRLLSLVPPADICCLLDAPADWACRRLAGRGTPNRQERPHLLERVRSEYLHLCRSRPEIVRVDATVDADCVQDQVRKVVSDWISSRL